MDIATLGIAVRSEQVDQANASLQRFAQASGAAERAAKNVGTEATKAGRMAAAANDNAAASASRAAQAYGGWEKSAAMAARAIGAVLGALATNALIQFADTWSDINARVGLAVGNMDASGVVLDRLATVARRTYSALDLTAESFIRNATVLRELGRTTADQLDYTEALNLALVVSGARADRAARVQDALGKAMAGGKLSGDELNTVIETGGRVAEVLAEELGIGVNQLRQFGADGKITGDVIYNALTKRMEGLRAEAELMPATMGDGVMLIRNSLMQYIGTMDQAAGASETFAAGLIIIADNIGRIVTTAATAVTMYGTYYVAAFVAANVATMTLAGSLAFLRAALIRTGIGAVVVLLGELVYQLIEARQHVDSWGQAFEDVFERSKAIAAAFGYGFESVVAGIQSVWATFLADMVEGFESSFGGILRAFGIGVEQVSGMVDKLRNEAELATALADASGNLAQLAWNHGTRPREGAAVELPGGSGSGIKPTGEVDKAAQRAAERAAKSYERITRFAQQYIEAQKLEAQAIGMTEREANRLRYTQDLLNQAQDAGIKLTSAQKAELEGLASAMADAEANTTALRDAFDFAKEVTSGFLNDFKSGLEQGKGVLRSFADAALGALNKIADKLIEMAINSLWANAFGGASGAASSGGGGMFGSLFSGLGKMFGFSSGGWTGSGATSAAAGFVHGQEFVVRAGPAAQHRQLLEAINSGRPVSANNNQPVAANGNQPVQINVNVSGARGNQEIMQMVESGVRQGIGEYDRNLAGRVNEIANDPRMVG